MSGKPTLLPCPFCAGTAMLDEGGIVIVECEECGATVHAADADDAVAAWNARAYDFPGAGHAFAECLAAERGMTRADAHRRVAGWVREMPDDGEIARLRAEVAARDAKLEELVATVVGLRGESEEEG